MTITRLRFYEGSTDRVTGTIVDRAGTVVPGSSLIAATLTLYDAETYDPIGSPVVGIINSRDHQDVLGVGSPLEAHGVTIHDTLQTDTDGSTFSFEWRLDPEDNPIVTPSRQIERHRAMFAFTADSGEVIPVEFEIEVMNLRGTV